MDILGDDLPWRKILAYILEIRTRSQPLRVFRNFISKRWPLGGNPGSKFSFSWWRPATSKCLFWAWICMFSDYELLDAESVQFSRSVVSNSLWPHGLPHTRPPCSSPSPGTCSNSCPLSQWCLPTILSFVVSLYLWLIHAVLWQKLTQHCKAIILQFKKFKN